MPGSSTPDPLGRFVMPTATSGWAIAAGYAGLFALTCVFAPVALLLGIVAYRDLKRRPELHGWGRTYLGLILGGLGTAVLLFFLGAVVVEQMGKQ